MQKPWLTAMAHPNLQLEYIFLGCTPKGGECLMYLGGVGEEVKARKLQNWHKCSEDMSEQIILNWHQ